MGPSAHYASKDSKKDWCKGITAYYLLEAGDIVMRHIPGIINPADDLTKPLGWVLHARHARRIMGFKFHLMLERGVKPLW